MGSVKEQRELWSARRTKGRGRKKKKRKKRALAQRELDKWTGSFLLAKTGLVDGCGGRFLLPITSYISSLFPIL